MFELVQTKSYSVGGVPKNFRRAPKIANTHWNESNHAQRIYSEWPRKKITFVHENCMFLKQSHRKNPKCCKNICAYWVFCTTFYPNIYLAELLVTYLLASIMGMKICLWTVVKSLMLFTKQSGTSCIKGG